MFTHIGELSKAENYQVDVPHQYCLHRPEHKRWKLVSSIKVTFSATPQPVLQNVLTRNLCLGCDRSILTIEYCQLNLVLPPFYASDVPSVMGKWQEMLCSFSIPFVCVRRQSTSASPGRHRAGSGGADAARGGHTYFAITEVHTTISGEGFGLAEVKN